MEITPHQGDIAGQEVDAIVNAANTSLVMGSGVAGALRSAGGDALNDAAVSKGPIELGGVVETAGYDLPCEYVIHAAAMPAGGSATADSIRDATKHSLELADELGCESIVFPALGCGVAGFDLRAGFERICETIQEHEPMSLTDARIIAYGEESYAVLTDVLDDMD